MGDFVGDCGLWVILRCQLKSVEIVERIWKSQLFLFLYTIYTSNCS